MTPTLIGGGAERVAVTLAKALAETDEVVIVTYASAEEPALDAEVRSEAATWGTVVEIESRSRVPLLRFPRLVRQIHHTLKSLEPDAALAVLTYSNLLLAAGRLLPRAGPWRVVGTEHSTTHRLRRKGWRNRLVRLAVRQLYRRMDAVIAVADAVSDDFVDLLHGVQAPPFVTIHNPVDGPTIRRMADSDMSEADARAMQTDGTSILTVSRIVPEKNLDVVLRMLTELPSGYRLVHVGPGDVPLSLRAMVKEFGLESRVSWLGARANPYPFMKRAAVTVLASQWEGFGLVAVEAAALGRPFVGTEVGGLHEVCRILGYKTVPPGDHHALAIAVQQASLESIESASLRHAAAQFDVLSTSAAYRRVLAGDSAR